MRLIIILSVLAMIGLTACKGDAAQVEIKGEIKGLGNDTIYLFGNDELSDFIESIAVVNDKFSLTIPMDTLSQAILFLNDQEQYPVYLEKGKKIQIKGDRNTPGVFEVKGTKLNEEMTAFNKSLSNPGNASDTLTLQKVEEYIHNHQKSLLNIYLLNTYFVEQPEPYLIKIKELIGIMDGTLQDKPYIEKLTEIITQSEKSDIDKIAPTFTLSNAEGKRISRSDFRDKFLLITFWASWSDSCKTSNEELKKIHKRYPPRKEKTTSVPAGRVNRAVQKPELGILGISLDLDKKEWMETIKRDTLNWEQVSDFSGWASTVIKQFGVNEIPYHILIDNKGKIIARGIRGEELNEKLKELLEPNT